MLISGYLIVKEKLSERIPNKEIQNLFDVVINAVSFCDTSKKYEIPYGVGIIFILIKYQEKFKDMLIEFYETNGMSSIKSFIYDNYIDGIQFPKENNEKEDLWVKNRINKCLKEI